MNLSTRRRSRSGSFALVRTVAFETHQFRAAAVRNSSQKQQQAPLCNFFVSKTVISYVYKLIVRMKVRTRGFIKKRSRSTGARQLLSSGLLPIDKNAAATCYHLQGSPAVAPLIRWKIGEEEKFGGELKRSRSFWALKTIKR